MQLYNNHNNNSNNVGFIFLLDGPNYEDILHYIIYFLENCQPLVT